MKFQKLAIIFSLLIYISCSNNGILITGLEGVSKSIKEQYAPDKRVAIFDINFDNSDDKIIATGITNSKEAYQKLVDSLQSLDVSYINNIRVLPDTVVGNKMFAVARNSVINIRSAPKHSAELGTQGLLGMSLKILDKAGDFYRIQTPDNYISWVDKGGIQKMNKGEFDTWNASKKIIFTKNFGYVYNSKQQNSTIVSDITLGGLLKYLSEDASFYEVKYPDNRTGFVKKSEAVVYENWLKNLQPSKENVEKVAKKLEGFPYLWGGTSSKGIDCSGFTKMVYLMNGFVIPRDASQQINAGKQVDEKLNFENLEKGDLLFFGTEATETKKRRVVHVGIWLGNNKQEFIHASGNVHISSMDSLQPHFDAFNKNRYLGSKRYLGIKDKEIINLKEEFKF
ncbi:SH3 domain-containing C40 family peptidase [Polaribacter sp. KT 15]|uniref:C40 family peptidase n=1 Tax=Polaribacter sp. KT 15 TaxID=1896175 RepID=UPI00090BB452|nr:SH3 domain-containing C40 family peptidase [Polaribacter sp. KT 15]SHM77021.1 SH3 domain-containing protein [Polaribacter sp. KT 15]